MEDVISEKPERVDVGTCVTVVVKPGPGEEASRTPRVILAHSLYIVAILDTPNLLATF